MPPKSSKARADTVLGGLEGGWRATGDEPSQQNKTGVAHTTNTIPFEGKEIVFERHGESKEKLGLIFTHGAGGGISNPATRSFVEGFSRTAPAISFQGTMNLQSRTKSFHAVIEHENVASVALGGRSMGARAAALAAADHATKHLILVSYPLVGQNGQVRDEILLNIDAKVSVLFISGSADNMCSIKQLNTVRTKMKARSWLAVIQGADHGMSMRPKEAVDKMREYTGEFAAHWIQRQEADRTECSLRWNAHQKEVVDEGWKAPAKPSSMGKSFPEAHKESQPDLDDAEDGRPAKRQRKR